MEQIWNNELPKWFRPEQIDSGLAIGGNQLTLLGIWQIHPESITFYHFEMALYAIKEILGDGQYHFDVNASELKKKLPNLSDPEILQIFKLIQGFRELNSGLGQTLSDGPSIKIGHSTILEEYRQFSGLRPFMAMHLKNLEMVVAY